MTGENTEIQRKRAWKALLIVGFVISGLIVAIGLLEDGPRSDERTDTHANGSREILSADILQALSEGLDVNEAIKSRTPFLLFDLEDAPDWFKEEVIDPNERSALGIRSEVMADSDLQTVGFVSNKDRESVMHGLEDWLLRHGWDACEEKTVMSFVKGEGEARWMTVQCVGIGDETSVVLHIAHG